MNEALFALVAVLSEERRRPDSLAPVLELMTIDDGGYPFCCLLSVRQIAVKGAEMYALVRGRRPNAHLVERNRATLVFVHDNAFASLQLRTVASRPLGAATLWTFEAREGTLDKRAEVLQPMSYRAPDLDEAEGPSIADLLR